MGYKNIGGRINMSRRRRRGRSGYVMGHTGFKRRRRGRRIRSYGASRGGIRL